MLGATGIAILPCALLVLQKCLCCRKESYMHTACMLRLLLTYLLECTCPYSSELLCWLVEVGVKNKLEFLRSN